MPHSNPKVQKLEDDVTAAIKAHGNKHGGKKEKATITRSALLTYAAAEIKALRDAVAAGEPTLSEAITHTEVSVTTIADLLEAAS